MKRVGGFFTFGGAVVNRDESCDDPLRRLTNLCMSRRQLLKLLGGACAYGVLASFPTRAALSQVSTGPAASSDSIRGPAIATEEQAWRWLSANDAHEQTYGWSSLAWVWGEAVGIRPDLMLAQQMFETGWGYFGGMVTPEHHNVAGIKVGDANAGDLPEDFERFASWSEGIRAHANHLAAYSGAVPALGPSGEPLHDRYYLVMGLPWIGSVQTIDGLSGKWSTRGDYAQVLLERFLAPLRNS